MMHETRIAQNLLLQKNISYTTLVRALKLNAPITVLLPLGDIPFTNQASTRPPGLRVREFH